MNGHVKLQPQQTTASSLKPFAELARLQKPTGALLIYFPCLYGTFLLASMLEPIPSASTLVLLNSKLLLGSALFRFLGCTWNDIVDRDVDRQVRRTRSRPLPRGSVTVRQALVFAILQLCVGIAVTLASLPRPCFVWGIPSMLLTILYPYGKSFTNYPQLILGLVFSWGVLLAVPAMNAEAVMMKQPKVMWAQVVLYLSCTAWTVLYDTIYAAQDVSDDSRLGLYSTMTAHKRNPRSFLRIVCLLQCSGLVAVAFLADVSWVYLTGLVTTVVALVYMIEKVDLSNPKSCAWWFGVGDVRIALIMTVMFLGEYWNRRYTLNAVDSMRWLRSG